MVNLVYCWAKCCDLALNKKLDYYLYPKYTPSCNWKKSLNLSFVRQLSSIGHP